MSILFGNYELKAIQENEALREEFLEEIIYRYSQSVMWFAYTYVKEEQLAEEITQDVFLTCYNKIGIFRNESSLKTWIYRITANKCKDQLRKRTLKNILSNKGQDRDNLGVNQNNPESILMQKVEDEVLAENVMSLPIKFKEVVYMYYFEGMKLKEISEALHVKENTVKTRLSRGRTMLRKMYKEGLNDY